MSVERCSQCKTPRRPGETSCRRCGLVFTRSSRPGGPTLVLRQSQPEESDQPWELGDESVEVGRANPAARISLSHSSVSRRHARISYANGAFLVEDLGSSNHTFVNDREINAPTVISDGDQLLFGEVLVQAQIRLPGSSSRESSGYSSKDDPGGRTINYLGESPVQSPPEGRADVRTPVPQVPDAEATMNDVVVAPVGRTSRPPAGRPVLSPDEDRRNSPPPVVVKTSTRQKPAAEHHPRSLPDLTLAADDLAASLRDLNSELSDALQTFDQIGGRAALQAIVAQARRVETNPRSAQELEALIGWLPTACRMLETELTLIRLVSRSQSDALG